MFELKINQISLAEYLPEKGLDLREESESGDDGFVCYDGTVVGESTNKFIVMDISLEKVPYGIAKAISTAVRAEKIPVSFNYPYAFADNFSCKSYSATARHKGLAWDIKMTLKSCAAVSSSCL